MGIDLITVVSVLETKGVCNRIELDFQFSLSRVVKKLIPIENSIPTRLDRSYNYPNERKRT